MERKGTIIARRRVCIAGLSMALVWAPAGSVTASAPPVVRCIQSYGHEIPADPCDPNPNQFNHVPYQGKVYPNSLLYPTTAGFTAGFSGPTGRIYVEGNATPGSTITLTVSDDRRKLGPFTVGTQLTSSPNGPRAGDFFAEFDVAELGGHRATPEGNVGDARLGPATLTIRAYATDDSVDGPEVVNTIVKHAASDNDFTPPELSSPKWPEPKQLSHSCPEHLTRQAVTDLSKVLGIPEPNNPKSQCPWYPIAGTLRDLTEAGEETVSEISDVRIIVAKEPFGPIYIDVRHSVDSEHLPPNQQPILTRNSSDHSQYRYWLNIRDLPPNHGTLIGMDFWYTITLIACDAWGDVDDPSVSNCLTRYYGPIEVYP